MFQVGGENWNLSLVEPYNTNLMRSDGVYTLGVTDNNQKTVFINNRLRGRMLEKVICHELVHVFCFENELNLPIETEELIADFLATYGREVFEVADDILRRFVRVA